MDEAGLDSMADLIARRFAETFATWEFTLPRRDLARRTPGFISRKGWLVQYCFGEDERSRYLDYYAAHRMTDDDHVRIREDGTTEVLPAISGFYCCSGPEGQKEARRRSAERNRAIAQTLVEKGFTKFTLNMSLAASLDAGDET
jgi:hypothetical protein